jgi:hypothetical protein
MNWRLAQMSCPSAQNWKVDELATVLNSKEGNPENHRQALINGGSWSVPAMQLSSVFTDHAT